MELISRYNSKWNVKAFCFLLKRNFTIFHTNNSSDDITFSKFEGLNIIINYFHFIIEFYVVVRPGATIGADHVPTVAQRAKIELVGLGYHYIFVADAHCNPIGIALFNAEVECFTITSFLQTRLHDSKLVPCIVLGLYLEIINQLDVIVFHRSGKLELW